MTPIDFWFDFASPYGFLMGERIDALAAAHGRTVRWRPLLLFAVLRQLDLPAPMGHPAKRDYMLLDFERSARHLGVTYCHPSRFPVVTPLPGRLFHVLAERDAAAAAAFARAAMQLAFQHDRPLDDAAMVAGFIINRFRGDVTLFDDGYRWLEDRTGWRGFGVIASREISAK